MKKILMLIHTFPPIGSVGGSIRIIKLLKYINELKPDFSSTIITLKDNFVLLNDLQLAQASISEIPPNVKIIRTNTFQPRHPNSHEVNSEKNPVETNNQKKSKSTKYFIKKVYKIIERNFLIPDYGILWFPFSLKAALREIKKNNIELIYATAPPFSVLIQAAIIKRITNKKLVLDIKDDWMHMTRFDENPGALQRKIEIRMERFCVYHADKVILVTESSLNDFIRRYPQQKDKFVLITNGCDVSEYKNYWTQQFADNKKFTIIHSGVMTSTRNPSGFFKAIKELQEEEIISPKNFEMKFIGHMPHNIVEMIEKVELNEIITSCAPLEREDYIKAISKANLLVAFNYQIKTLIPGKLYDYWGSRKPILLIDLQDSTAAKFVEKNKIGKVKDFEDSIGIKTIIKEYFDLWLKGLQVPLNDVENLSLYDRKELTKQLIALLDNI